MKKNLPLSIIFLLLFSSMFGQSGQAKDEFKPSGKSFVKIYTNYHSNFTNGTTRNLFEVTRAYMGYKYSFSKYFSGKVNLDVGNPGVGKLQMTAYLKNAYVQYKKNGLTVRIGLIGTYIFNFQESHWGNRYLFKSFQDQNGFGPSADLGVSIAYQLNSFVSADFSVLNGEGYKRIEVDSTLKYTMGVTLKPTKALAFRVYYDYMNKKAAQQTLSFFLAYTRAKWKGGAEYNKQYNHGMSSGKDYSGYSFYATYYFKKVNIFGRYDYLSSVTMANEVNPWNFAKDGQEFIAGIEFSPVKGVRISPNYQLWKPRNRAKSSVSGAYLSLQIKF
ncbi:MAG: hypothetical protein IEMM0006_1739 [bacterium]|nr:MAG: hypothetical protein IEMM0006_1739 [bacterium]